MEEVYDNKILYLYTNGLSERQIATSICEGIEKFEKESGIEIDAYFRINMVYNQEKESLGYAWLFTENSTLYYLLSGNNPDGTERIERVPVSHYVAPTISEEERVEQLMQEEIERYGSNSWVVVEKDEIRNRVKREYEVPTTEKRLPPLLTLPYVVGKDGEKRRVDISRGKLSFPPPYFIEHQLKNSKYSKIPPWLTRKKLYALFRPYVSDLKDFSYPKIRFISEDGNNTVFIEYKKGTTDAICALQMMKKIYLPMKNTDKEYILSFNFPKIHS